MVCKPKRKVSRFSLCSTFYCTVRTVRKPCRLFQFNSPDKMAIALRVKPDGGGDRRVSLGNHRKGVSCKLNGLGLVAGDNILALGHRNPTVSSNGKAVR